MLVLTVFTAKSVKLSPSLDELRQYFSQINSLELSQSTILKSSVEFHSQRRKQKLVQKSEKFPSTQKRSWRWNLYLSCVLLAWSVESPLVLNGPIPKKNYQKKLLLVLLFSTALKRTTQMMSNFDNFAFSELLPKTLCLLQKTSSSSKT